MVGTELFMHLGPCIGKSSLGKYVFHFAGAMSGSPLREDSQWGEVGNPEGVSYGLLLLCGGRVFGGDGVVDEFAEVFYSSWAFFYLFAVYKEGRGAGDF
jgi:hypothetical protein